VRIDLVIRGICTVRPGVEGLSENIRVRSIVGRFLEHSRILRFGNGGGGSGSDEEFWIGSADMMHRNLDRRIEAMVRVTDNVARGQLREVLDLSTADDTGGFDLHADGNWIRRLAPDGGPLKDVQVQLLRRIAERGV
jgi:polyphosphate kinase